MKLQDFCQKLTLEHGYKNKTGALGATVANHTYYKTTYYKKHSTTETKIYWVHENDMYQTDHIQYTYSIDCPHKYRGVLVSNKRWSTPAIIKIVNGEIPDEQAQSILTLKKLQPQRLDKPIEFVESIYIKKNIIRTNNQISTIQVMDLIFQDGYEFNTISAGNDYQPWFLMCIVLKGSYRANHIAYNPDDKNYYPLSGKLRIALVSTYKALKIYNLSKFDMEMLDVAVEDYKNRIIPSLMQ